MKNLGYETYVSDPEIPRAIEREARRARNETINRLVITPLISAFGRLLKLALQALQPMLTLANLHFYSPSWVSNPEFNCNTQPRS